MEYVVSTRGLTKRFGKNSAVNNVSLHVKRGEIYGFIGRNGAGKTTFMKMISGLSEPTEGEIVLFGDTGRAAGRHHSRIGNLIEQPGLYPGMTGLENLHCKCLALGIHDKKHEEELLLQVGLGEAGKKKIKQYSLGMKQRLGIAMALAGRPDLLILDEPVNGLDPQGVAEIREFLIQLKEEKNMTILISSHILEELYKLADSFGIIHKGELIQEITREELDRKCSNCAEIITENTALACTVLEKCGYRNFRVMEEKMICVYDQLDNLGQLNMALVKAGCIVNSIQMKQENLENYFLELTRD